MRKSLIKLYKYDNSRLSILLASILLLLSNIVTVVSDQKSVSAPIETRPLLLKFQYIIPAISYALLSLLVILLKKEHMMDGPTILQSAIESMNTNLLPAIREKNIKNPAVRRLTLKITRHEINRRYLKDNFRIQVVGRAILFGDTSI